MTHISDNKNDYNVRRVEELTKELTELEKSLANETKFFRKCRIKRVIKKLTKQIEVHGEEILLYEQNK